LDSNKIKTYINFAKKSRNIIYGLDDIIKSTKVKLVIVSSDLAEKSGNKINKFVLENNIFKIDLEQNEFYELLQVDAVKVFAITDINLAKAIKMNFTNTVSNGGNLE
jgi:ribosomal protein L7Ae-like RNA K-turn-binding protein